jgi:hypothetical protein
VCLENQLFGRSKSHQGRGCKRFGNHPLAAHLNEEN